jgi:hypothetical protein
MVQALADSARVRSLLLIPRPITIHERLLGKWPPLRAELPAKVKLLERTSFDLFGPLKGRRWARSAYKRLWPTLRELAQDQQDGMRVLLDFTPIARIDYYQSFPGYKVWYDLIDDFRRHNRFGQADRDLVRRKYDEVRMHADLVTGVTSAALEGFAGRNTMVVANGVASREPTVTDPAEAEYDLGFIGFVTDKFDIDMIRTIAEDGGMSVVVHGQVYDRAVARRLQRVQNVTLTGPFEEKRLPETMKSFAVGLIPYRADRSHHGSPIKLYQYITSGRAVVSSHAYPGESDRLGELVCVFEGKDKREFIATVRQLVQEARGCGIERSRRISRAVSEEVTWSAKVDLVLDRLEETSAGAR